MDGNKEEGSSSEDRQSIPNAHEIGESSGQVEEALQVVTTVTLFKQLMENPRWECLQDILLSDLTTDILCSIGMPVVHCGVRYNCNVLCFNGRILLIRPKLYLANDGNYRELRWFSAWKNPQHFEELQLPFVIAKAISQSKVPFGDACLSFLDTTLGIETCEELFTPLSPHISLALRGVEIFVNGSGSHHQLRKLHKRLELIRAATGRVGGVYLYANQQGCDGGRLYYDGCACIAVNGDVVAQGSQFSPRDVEVLTACVDLDTVTSYRGAISSLREQASQQQPFPCVEVDALLGVDYELIISFPSFPIEVKYHVPEEEIALGPACWLWDYLRRSGASGFLLPLSGGADSSAVAAILGCMCQLVVKAVTEGDAQVQADARRVGHYDDHALPGDPKEFASRILQTIYMGSENSSENTRKRAELLAEQIGASHSNLKIDAVVSALLYLFKSVTGKAPQYKVDGGSNTENLALQNLQARIRMVIAFMLASLMPWVRSKPGFLLVLGSANVDEALRGYLTKYDCSSADINPIGGISKTDLRKFLRWGAQNLGYSALAEIEAAPPTAELEPIRTNYEQMGRTKRPEWQYLQQVKCLPKGKWTYKCNFCGRSWDGGPLRIRAHILGIAGHGVGGPCEEAPADVVEIVTRLHADTRPEGEDRAAFVDALVNDLEGAASQAQGGASMSTHVKGTTNLDEVDMGMTYEELSMYGRLRKIFMCGPVSMFQHLCHHWEGKLTAAQVAVKVKDFFKYYSLNRHKMTTLTPSYHAENYSPEDNRFDLRQFLYNTRWPWQFRRIDELVEASKAEKTSRPARGLSDGPTEAKSVSVQAGGLGVPAANAANASVGRGA
ncbi:hypothetical protein L7F22_049765 [Adiantum nelumboides]|nr:hypothetical protein [Adiantum nelumboides]